MTPEWVIVAGLTPQAVALYTVLLAHVNRQRHDGAAWPGMDVLAELLGYRRRQSVQPYVRELSSLGAIDVETQATRAGRRNVYIVNEVPPDGYAGSMSLAEFHAERRARRGWGAVAHDGSGAQAHDGSGAVAANNQTNTSRRSQRDENTSSDAFAADGQRTSSPTTNEDPQIRIFLPRTFKRMDDSAVMQHLVAASISALRAIGMTPAEDAADRIGRGLRIAVEEDHMDRDRLVSILTSTLGLAGTSDATWGNLAVWRDAG